MRLRTASLTCEPQLPGQRTTDRDPRAVPLPVRAGIAAPVTVVLDPTDNYTVMSAALAGHDPARGRITVHPTPTAIAPAALAHDVMRALGRHVPEPALLAAKLSPHAWAGTAHTAWRAVTAWVLALDITHITVTRAHLLTPRAWSDLLALRRATGIALTVVFHGSAAISAPAVLHDTTHRLADARTALQPPPRAHFRPAETAEGHGGLLRPPRAPQGHPTTRRPGTACPRPDPAALPVPRENPGPGPDGGAVLSRLLHTRIAHPAQAAALTLLVTTRASPDILHRIRDDDLSPHADAVKLHSRDCRHPCRTYRIPAWGRPLLAASRFYRQAAPGPVPHLLFEPLPRLDLHIEALAGLARLDLSPARNPK